MSRELIYRSEAGGRLLRERYRQALESWPVDNERLHVPTPEGETFVVVSGPAGAAPLVLLHGSGGNAAQWLGRIRGLAARFRVYAVDILGEPGLSAPVRPPLGSDRYAGWLDALLDGLGLDRVAIMGTSLGGWLAIDYATRRPGRVTRLALACPSGVGRQRKAFLLKVILLNALGRRGRRAAVRVVLGPALSAMDPAAVAALLEHVRVMSKNYRYRAGPVPVFDDETLRRLTMPVLVLAGQQDVMLDSAGTRRRLEATAPLATVRVLPGIGHLVPAQEAEELAFLTGPR